MSEDNQQPEGKWSGEDILLDRLALVGEELIPGEEFDHLSGQDWMTWLCELDLSKFPPHMVRLKEYLEQFMDSDEELDLDLEDEDLDQEEDPDQDQDQGE